MPQKIYVNVVGGLKARFSQKFQASQECGGGSKQGNKAFHPKSLKPLIQFILTSEKKKREKRYRAIPSLRLAQDLEEEGGGAISFCLYMSPDTGWERRGVMQGA